MVTSTKGLVQFLDILLAFCFFVTCEGQEKPLFTTPNFSNESHRQDFCTLHRWVEEGKMQRRHALRGINLHTILFEHQLNAETGAIDENNPDIAIDFLDELARRAGFQWRDSYGVGMPPQGNETWTDVLHWSSSAYDLVGEWFLRTKPRVEQGILFSEYWVNADMIMVRKSDTMESYFKWNSFLRPFTMGVWYLLAFTLIASGVVYFLLDFLDSRRTRTTLDSSLQDSVFNAAWAFTGHFNHDPKGISTRLVVFSLCFLCLLIVAAYTANLVSFLVQNTSALVINDFNALIVTGHSICVEKRSPIYEFLHKTYPTAKYVLIEEDTPGTEIFRSLERSECDALVTFRYLFEQRKRSSEYNKDCRLESFGNVIKDQQGHFTVMDSYKLCTSLVNDVLTIHMLEMKMDGAHDNLMERYYIRISTQNCSEEEEEGADESDSLHVRNVGGIFIVHLFAMVIATVLSLLQFLFEPKARKQQIVNEIVASIKRTITLRQFVPIANNRRSLSLSSEICLQGSDTVNRAQVLKSEITDNESEWQSDENHEDVKNEENVSLQLQKLQCEVSKVLTDLKNLETNMSQRKRE